MGTEITLKKAKVAVNIVNAFSEFLRITNLLLEAQRKELYVKDLPCEEYARWVQLPPEVQRTTFPPV